MNCCGENCYDPVAENYFEYINMKTLLMLGILMLSGCSPLSKQIEPIPNTYLTRTGQLNVDLIIKLAEDVAMRHGHDLNNFKSPEFNKENGEWYFRYEAKNTCLGCYFSISINEKTRTTFYSPGR